jgi:hypothetical protein
MKTHLHLSLLAWAPIATNRVPDEFGRYFETGHRNQSKGQALVFEADPAFHLAAWNIAEALT